MTKKTTSQLCAAAVVSRLLTEEQVEDAITALNESRGVNASLLDVDDDMLADQLVELGLLNRWQAEQLKAGP